MPSRKTPKRKTILVIGNGRHGKDTVAELISMLTGTRFTSSSRFAAEKAVYPFMRHLYPNVDACYEDRTNHRALWFHAISAYNLLPGPTLTEQILVDHEIYTGMRNWLEFENSRHLFDFVVWVDASRRLPQEPPSSMELTRDDATHVIDNNGDEDQLIKNVRKFVHDAGFITKPVDETKIQV